MSLKIERIAEGAELGEGPHWDAATNALYFVDIFGKTINRCSPATGQHTKATLAANKQISFIIPVDGKPNHFVVGLEEDLAIVSWDGQSDTASLVKKLANGKNQSEKNLKTVFNDGKCDSSGRLWAGTICGLYGLAKEQMDKLGETPAKGSLYSFGPNSQFVKRWSDIRISNGLAWNDKISKFYYIDTLKEVIDQYDFDINTGSISNQKTIFTLAKHDIKGLPDGMTIDTDGNLWVAIFEGSSVIKIDPRKPETLLSTISLPAKQITSVTFGGPNLDELYVTSGALQDKPTALDGATYRVTGAGAKGFPNVLFKL